MAKKNADQEAPPSGVTALILAGGAGERAGRRDKGTIEWMGKTLIEHVYERIAPQVESIIISCNRNPEFYGDFTDLTFPDLRPGYQGPLAGLESATAHISSEFVLVTPCDTPQLPHDLVKRLLQTLLDAPEYDGAYARSGDRNHYLCALIRYPCLKSLPTFLEAGGRAVRHWYGEHRFTPVDFAGDSEDFRNINHPE